MPHHVSRKLESSKNKDAALSTLPFSMGQAPPTGSSGRDDNPRKATRTPVGPCSARREAFLPYRHGPVCNSPSFVLPHLLCSSLPSCGTGLFRQKSYFDITLKIKSSSGDSVSLPKHHLAETGEDTAWHTPSIPHPINPSFPPTVFAHAQKGRTDGCRFGRGLFPSDLPILICMRRALSRLA